MAQKWPEIGEFGKQHPIAKLNGKSTNLFPHRQTWQFSCLIFPLASFLGNGNSLWQTNVNFGELLTWSLFFQCLPFIPPSDLQGVDSCLWQEHMITHFHFQTNKPCVLWRSLAWLRVNAFDAIWIASSFPSWKEFDLKFMVSSSLSLSTREWSHILKVLCTWYFGGRSIL